MLKETSTFENILGSILSSTQSAVGVASQFVDKSPKVKQAGTKKLRAFDRAARTQEADLKQTWTFIAIIVSVLFVGGLFSYKLIKRRKVKNEKKVQIKPI